MTDEQGYYFYIWYDHMVPMDIENLEYGPERPTLVDAIMASQRKERIDETCDHDGDGKITWEDLRMGRCKEKGMQWETLPLKELMKIDNELIAEYNALKGTDLSKYTVENLQFYPQDANYMIKQRVLVTKDAGMELALHYLDKLDLNRNDAIIDIQILYTEMRDVEEMPYQYDLSSLNEWKYLEDKVNHIERTYRRL